MFTPARADEITTIVGYIEQQLDAVRAAAIGLTDEQARLRPCRSALSIGGLIKHATHGMRTAVVRLSRAEMRADDLDEPAFVAHQASFVLADDEPAAAAIAEFDAVRTAYVTALTTTDPSAAIVEPPAPWHGRSDARPASARYFLVHQIEELARHAGHADILREQIDGMAVPAIVLSESGAPANEFFQPYVPLAGTLGAR
jgi:hypothetical protein